MHIDEPVGTEIDRAAGPDRVLDFQPGMTMRWEIIRSTADTGGELLETVNDPVRLINTHRPALRFEQMFRDLSTLIATGKIKRLPPKDPRSVLYVAMLFAKYQDEQYVTSPPNAVFKALALVAKTLRLQLDAKPPTLARSEGWRRR